jgi:hypothetical protein
MSGVMELSAAGGWMQAGMFVDDDEDELEAQACEWRLVTALWTLPRSCTRSSSM